MHKEFVPTNVPFFGTPGVCWLSFNCLRAIAAWSSPPVVYWLCLTSRRFFESVQLEGKEGAPVHCTATLLLRASLMASLKRVLRRQSGHAEAVPKIRAVAPKSNWNRPEEDEVYPQLDAHDAAIGMCMVAWGGVCGVCGVCRGARGICERTRAAPLVWATLTSLFGHVPVP